MRRFFENKKLLAFFLILAVVVVTSIWVVNSKKNIIEEKVKEGQQETMDLGKAEEGLISNQEAEPLQSTSTPGTQLYRNEKWGFEFEYPNDWSLHPNVFSSPFSKFNLIGATPKEKVPNTIIPSLLINIVTPDFADDAAVNFNRLKASTSIAVVADVKGTKYEYEFASIPQIAIDLPFGEYRILLGATKDNEDIFNQILASFKFLNDAR